MARDEWKRLDEGWVLNFDSENFIDPGAKRNYGNELGALKRSSAVVILSPSNPSYLRIKLTYIYTNTHTFKYKLSHNFSLSLSPPLTHTQGEREGGQIISCRLISVIINNPADVWVCVCTHVGWVNMGSEGVGS